MITIETAPHQVLKDYAEYVEAKIEIEEIPLTFAQWLEASEYVEGNTYYFPIRS